MSMFMCHRCDTLRDSDDGCKEGPRFSLICAACMDEEGDDPADAYANAAHPLRRHDRPFSAEQQALIDKWTAEAEEP